MVALVVAMLLFGLLAFHTPGLPSVRHTDASASSAYDRAMYVPGSARRKKGSAADGWVDESSGMMSQVLGGGAQISSTHRPNKYLQTRQKETEAAMDFMTELEVCNTPTTPSSSLPINLPLPPYWQPEKSWGFQIKPYVWKRYTQILTTRTNFVSPGAHAPRDDGNSGELQCGGEPRRPRGTQTR